jgi:hypothetical protein
MNDPQTPEEHRRVITSILLKEAAYPFVHAAQAEAAEKTTTPAVLDRLRRNERQFESIVSQKSRTINPDDVTTKYMLSGFHADPEIVELIDYVLENGILDAPE